MSIPSLKVNPDKRLYLSIIVAALLWFWMFSPWTSGLTDFWLTMASSAVVLTVLALVNTPGRLLEVRRPLIQLVSGVVLAFALWGIFWVGDKLSSMMFDFARPEVDAVYSMKDGSSAPLLICLLLFVVGPAEELFWRGYVQRSFESVIRRLWFSKDFAFLLTVIIYALVHIWSFNFMLVMAALTAGAVWGFIYRIKPSLLPALVVSHALWDALVFVILPI